MARALAAADKSQIKKRRKGSAYVKKRRNTQTFPGCEATRCNDARRRDASAPRRCRRRHRIGGVSTARGAWTVMGATSEPARFSQSRFGVVWFNVSCRSSVPRCAPLAVVTRTHRDYALSARGRRDSVIADAALGGEAFGISFKGETDGT